MKDFQAFTTFYPGRSNTLINDVEISQAYDLEGKNNYPHITVKGIWDTGATSSVITKQFANQLGLIPTGKITITGVNHVTVENTYIVNIYLPNHVCFPFMKIAEVEDLTGGAGLLIGMDIIGSCDFSTYLKDGKTVMTLRYPSHGCIDFVEEAKDIQSKRAITQKIETEIGNRKPLSEEDKLKRKNKRKLLKQQRKNRKRH